jgi:hypothetical protein
LTQNNSGFKNGDITGSHLNKTRQMVERVLYFNETKFCILELAGEVQPFFIVLKITGGLNGQKTATI